MDSISIYHSLQASLSRLTGLPGGGVGTPVSVRLPAPSVFATGQPDTRLAARSVVPRDPERSGLEGRQPSVAEPAADERPAEGAAGGQGFLAAALALQGQIRGELQGLSPEALLRGLPEQSILTAQWARDPDGTGALLAARLDALEKDTGETFHWLGRQSEARALLQQLREHHQRLVCEGGEGHLVTLIRGLVEYERTFHKDSWIQMVNMAFLGPERLMAGPCGQSLRALIPPERLPDGGDENDLAAALLDPDPVTRHNSGYLSCDPDGLADWMGQHLETQGKACLAGRMAQCLAQLTETGAPDRAGTLTAEHFLDWLQQSQPELAAQLLRLESEQMSYSTDPGVRHTGLQLLALMHDAGDTESRLDLVQDSALLASQLGTRVRRQVLLLRLRYLEAETQALLEEKTALEAPALTGLQDRLEQAQALSHADGLPGGARILSRLRARIRRITLVPLQQRLVRDNQAVPGEERLWFLGTEPALERVEAAVCGRATEDWAPLVAQLQAYLQLPPPQNLEELRQTLLHKDRVMTAQQDYCLSQARRCLGKEPDFDIWTRRAREIEAARPPWQLIGEDMSFATRVARAGRACLRPDRLPLAHQISGLNLEHQLHLRGYDFREEIGKLVRDIPQISGPAGEATAEACQALQALLDDWRQGDKSPIQLLRALGQAGQRARDGFAEALRNTLAGAAVIGQASPRTLRALYGNMAQTLASLGATVGPSSQLYRLWNELYSRVSAEAQAQYFVDALRENDAGPTLEQLDEEQLAAVKRLVALGSLLSYSRGVPKVVEGLLATVTGGFNPLNLAWNAARTGIGLLGSWWIDKTVNGLDATDIRIANTTMDILHEGPLAAGRRQRVMEWAGRVMADMACRKTAGQTLVRASVFYPFRALYHSLSGAFAAWRQGTPGSLLQLGIMAAKAAPVVLPVAVALGGLLATPLLSLAFVFSLASLPAALWLSWSWARWMVDNTGLVDIATLALGRARQIQRAQGRNFHTEAERLLTETGFMESVGPCARNQACAALGRQFWSSWAQASPDNARMARQLDAAFASEQEQAQDGQAAQLARLDRIATSLRAQEQRSGPVTLEWVRANVPEEELDSLPPAEQSHHLEVWLLACRERLWDELRTATGCHALPESGTVLQQWIAKHNLERMRGLALLALCPEARERQAATTEAICRSLFAEARERTALFLAEGLVLGLTSVFHSRALAAARRAGPGMRPEEFAQILEQDAQLQTAIRQQFADVYMAQIRRFGPACHQQLKKRLQASGQACSDEHVHQLVEAAQAMS